MTDSNRTRIAAVRNATLGTLPGSPRFRIGRMTGESLRYAPVPVMSDEIRSDRMSADPVIVNNTNAGGVNFELSFPESLSFLSELIASAMFSDWTLMAERDNDGSADSVITAVTASSDTYTCTDTGADFVAGQLVRATGFTNSGNNQLFKAQSSSSGTACVAPSSPGLTDEAAPPATARLKVVGFQGASGDIVAATSGLTSTLLDFTTLGLSVGQLVKIGGSASGDKFATAANNGFARITSIAAHVLGLDNLPTGWAADAGATKTIMVFVGDMVKNGTTMIGMSIERAFLAQQTPTYILQNGMVVNSLRLDFASERIVTGAAEFMGMNGSEGTSANGSTYEDATTATPMSANVSVGRIAEGGSVVSSPNYVRSASITLTNNLRMQTAVGTVGAIGIGAGECDVMVDLETYFGTDTLYAKMLAGTATSINLRAQQSSQAISLDIPRLTLLEGSPSAGSKNTDVMLPLRGRASKDSTFNAHLIINRLEYYQ